MLLLCAALLGASIPACDIKQVAAPDRAVSWRIALTDRNGHRFVIVQTKDSLDLAFKTCSKWLKAQSKKKR